MRKWYPAVGHRDLDPRVGRCVSKAARSHSHPLGHPRAGQRLRPKVGRARRVSTGPARALGILRFLPAIEPRRANYAKFQSTYDLVVNLVLTVVLILQGAPLAAAFGRRGR